MNKGVVLITPVVLVRFLSVEDFGYYREFLVYAGLLTAIAAFGIDSSLLRFVPENPKTSWRFVNHAVVMTSLSSVLVVAGMLLLNAVAPGALVDEYVLPLALYVLFFANLDFWAYLWLAEKRSFAVLGYSTGRLLARVIVVTTTAALTRDVDTIIVALVSFEGLRLLISLVAWRIEARRRNLQGPAFDPTRWREQLQYCLPFGGALVVVNLNRSMGSLFVAKILGPVALAHYAIGLYVQPVLTIIRNSLSDVVLPEIVSRNGQHSTPADRLRLWRRTTVVTAIFLFASGVMLANFAEILVVTLFSAEYRPAVVLFQLFLLVFLRDALDFGIPLRAMNRNKPILYSNLIALGVNAALMLLLMPRWGAAGAVAALVVSRFVEGTYLATELARAYDVPLRRLAPWKDMLKVLAAALLAGAVLYGDFWTEHLGLFGVVIGAGVYTVVFAVLLSWANIPEVGMLKSKLLAMPAIVLRRQQ